MGHRLPLGSVLFPRILLCWVRERPPHLEQPHLKSLCRNRSARKDPDYMTLSCRISRLTGMLTFESLNAMDLPDDEFLDWGDVSPADKGKVIKHIKKLVSSGAWSPANITKQVSAQFDVKVPMSAVTQTLLQPARSSFQTVQDLIQQGRIDAAIAILRRRQPAVAYRMIQRLLLGGKIKGPQAISLITRSIPEERWHELEVQSN